MSSQDSPKKLSDDEIQLIYKVVVRVRDTVLKGKAKKEAELVATTVAMLLRGFFGPDVARRIGHLMLEDFVLKHLEQLNELQP